MAEGIVTSSAAEFRGILADIPGPIAQLALKARALIFDVFPQTVEVVWQHQKTAGYGTGPKKMTEHFIWLAPQTRCLRFSRGHSSRAGPIEILARRLPPTCRLC